MTDCVSSPRDSESEFQCPRTSLTTLVAVLTSRVVLLGLRVVVRFLFIIQPRMFVLALSGLSDKVGCWMNSIRSTCWGQKDMVAILQMAFTKLLSLEKNVLFSINLTESGSLGSIWQEGSIDSSNVLWPLIQPTFGLGYCFLIIKCLPKIYLKSTILKHWTVSEWIGVFIREIHCAMIRLIIFLIQPHWN